MEASSLPRVDPASSLLLTDLYELNMHAAYLADGMTGAAVFEFFVRDLPPRRNFLMAAGLEHVIEYLKTVGFTDEERAWLASTGRFTPAFVEALANLRFTGDVDAMPEGTIFFPDEPILRIVAPMPEAQFVFLAPPTVEELRDRLAGRGTEAAEVIEARLDRARIELEADSEFDVVVVNDDVERAAAEVVALLTTAI